MADIESPLLAERAVLAALPSTAAGPSGYVTNGKDIMIVDPVNNSEPRWVHEEYEERHAAMYGEQHRSNRTGWLRVSSQADVEEADLEQEKRQHALHPDFELDELTRIYEARGLQYSLARQVAEELSKQNALIAHMRDELGITEVAAAKPLQAGLVSAVSFSLGAAMPVAAMYFAPQDIRIKATAAVMVLTLAFTGSIGAYLGGAKIVRGAVRVLIGGVLAMLIVVGIRYLYNG
eukprot:jgi/Chlat1/3800/Chrsp259S03947